MPEFPICRCEVPVRLFSDVRSSFELLTDVRSQFELPVRGSYVTYSFINPFTYRNETNTSGHPGMVPDATVGERARPQEVVRVS